MSYRQKQRQLENDSRAEERGIVIPPPANPLRRLALEAGDPCDWLSTYLPHRFTRWTDTRRRMVQEILYRIRNGGDKAIAAPRGDGKTSVAEGVVGIYAPVRGLVRFPVLLCSTGTDAARILRNIKLEYEKSEPFIADYPEYCVPVVELQGAPQRCGMQVDKRTGERTRMVWSGEWVQFPTVRLNWCPVCLVEGYEVEDGRWHCRACDCEYNEWVPPGAGAVFATRGVDAAIRGLRVEALRPDFVLIDDPETRESARSAKQCADREGIIDEDAGGLAGPETKMSRLMLCTLQTPDCLSARFTDPRQKPSWAGERIPQVQRWPDRKDLWERYGELRQDGQRSTHDVLGRGATQFYIENREEMDAGVVVANPFRFCGDLAEDGLPIELSAIQSVHNHASDKGWDYVFCELQNDPPEPDGMEGIPSVHDMATRWNQSPAFAVPPGVSTVTAFVDVSKDVLWWTVVGWSESFGGNVIAYGAFPEQRRKYFTLNELSTTIGKWYQSANGALAADDAMIYAALNTLTSQLLTMNWTGPQGERYELERIGVDSGWGQHTETIYMFTQQSSYRARLLPTKGLGVGAKNTPLVARTLKENERRGLNWILRVPQGRQTRLLEYDTNFWKQFIHSRLALPVGSKGALMLFGDDKVDHRMLASHLHAETRVEVSANGRTVLEYMLRPGEDNHWFDCLVGSAVMASVSGIATDVQRSQPVKPTRKYGVLSSKKANA